MHLSRNLAATLENWASRYQSAPERLQAAGALCVVIADNDLYMYGEAAAGYADSLSRVAAGKSNLVAYAGSNRMRSNKKLKKNKESKRDFPITFLSRYEVPFRFL